MGMQVGEDGGKVKPEMNVTPLVDIVLVLLIIFLVLAPVMAKGLFVRVPPKEDLDEALAELVNDDQPPVLYVTNEGELMMDGRISLEENPQDLALVLNARTDRQVYVDAEDETEFRHVIEAVNFARGSGAKPVVMLAEPFKVPGK